MHPIQRQYETTGTCENPYYKAALDLFYKPKIKLLCWGCAYPGYEDYMFGEYATCRMCHSRSMSMRTAAIFFACPELNVHFSDKVIFYGRRCNEYIVIAGGLCGTCCSTVKEFAHDLKPATLCVQTRLLLLEANILLPPLAFLVAQYKGFEQIHSCPTCM